MARKAQVARITTFPHDWLALGARIGGGPTTTTVTAEIPTPNTAIVRAADFIDVDDHLAQLTEQITKWCAAHDIVCHIEWCEIRMAYVTTFGNAKRKKWMVETIRFETPEDMAACQAVFAEVY